MEAIPIPQESGGSNVKVIDIGDWDMDATSAKNVAHGLSDNTKIRSILVAVRDDGGFPYSFSGKDVSIIGSSPTNIEMIRLGGGYFDSANFNLTSYNRGWITIWYID